MTDLFERVHKLLGDSEQEGGVYRPKCPETIEQSGLTREEVEETLDQLEATQNPHTKVCEAPLQLKSNCGMFVIDDFGRQRCPVADLPTSERVLQSHGEDVGVAVDRIAFQKRMDVVQHHTRSNGIIPIESASQVG